MPTLRRTMFAAAAAGATSVSLLAGSPSATAATAAPIQVGSTSPCQDVVYIGAEGSGQAADDFHGFGPEVWFGLEAYTDQLPSGYRVGYFPVPYPSATADVSVLLSQKGRRTFFDSIDSGVAETMKFLAAREPLCRASGERYVLSGYSQGAMVMHRVLWQLADARKQKADLASKVLPRIDGLLLVADGDRVSYQGGMAYGSATPNGQGIWWLGSSVGATGAKYKPVNQPVPTVPGWDSSRFHSVCEEGDLVCDAGTLNVAGGAIHGNAYNPSGYGFPGTQAAAARIAAYTQAIKPLPVDPNPTPSGQLPVRVGQLGTATLADDGGFVSSLQWLTDPIPGAVLSPGDYTIPAVLTYTPTTAGMWPFGIRVIATDGTVTDVTGAFVAYPIPDPSLAVRNLTARYDTTTYPLAGSVADFDIVKTAASDTTPLKHFTTRENGASDGFDYAGGDNNGNGKLDLGETWHYAGISPWYDDTVATMSRTIVIKANDGTGAGAWQETTANFTVNR